MGEEFGISRAAISLALRRLVDGGAVKHERRHVQGRFYRVKVYQLTPQGEALARHVQESIEPGRRGSEARQEI